MADTPPFCRDCIWVRRAHDDAAWWRCAAPQNIRTDIVTGEATPKIPLCGPMRSFYSASIDEACGYQGRWFEPKESKENAANG